MSTTAEVIITDALKEIGVLGESETPSAAMLSDGLRMLNRMLDTFANDTDFAYSASKEVFTLAGAQSFTIGPTGDVVSTRPIRIETAFADKNGVTYPVTVIDNQQYDLLTYKTLSGANPLAIYYEGTFPNGTVYCYPESTGYVLTMRVINTVKQFANSTIQIDMPEGYEDAIMLNLAVRSGPMYGKQASQDTKIAAKRTLNDILRTNRIIPTMELPKAVQSRMRSNLATFLSGG